ncbi:transmembrane transport protein [Kitasatospora sp. NPDC052868]|uniref:transmembrane transport protein n=1 Tax=Kitasatospora sp. NPDC052868 TaxID=3364060 RepID=UPI0037C60ECA
MSEYHDAARRAVPKELERALEAEVSLRSRMRHVAVGLGGCCSAALVTVLWVTEPHPLPARTQAAFAGLIAVGLAWAAFTGWVLSRRRPLFARDQVLGARLALAVSAGTCAVGTTLAATRGTTAETLATALAGGVLIAVAGLLLARAHARRRALLRLRDTLREGAD